MYSPWSPLCATCINVENIELNIVWIECNSVKSVLNFHIPAECQRLQCTAVCKTAQLKIKLHYSKLALISTNSIFPCLQLLSVLKRRVKYCFILRNSVIGKRNPQVSGFASFNSNDDYHNWPSNLLHVTKPTMATQLLIIRSWTVYCLDFPHIFK